MVNKCHCLASQSPLNRVNGSHQAYYQFNEKDHCAKSQSPLNRVNGSHPTITYQYEELILRRNPLLIGSMVLTAMASGEHQKALDCRNPLLIGSMVLTSMTSFGMRPGLHTVAIPS